MLEQMVRTDHLINCLLFRLAEVWIVCRTFFQVLRVSFWISKLENLCQPLSQVAEVLALHRKMALSLSLRRHLDVKRLEGVNNTHRGFAVVGG